MQRVMEHQRTLVNWSKSGSNDLVHAYGELFGMGTHRLAM
jgi:hypothetical protein